MIRYEFEAIGTSWIIDIKNNLSSQEEVILLNKIKERINIFDLNYSRFKENSLVTKMSKESGGYILPEDADKMISLYQKMFEISGGLVTPLIGQTLVEAGYDAKYSLEEKALSKVPLWNEVVKWESPKLTVSQPVLLDFGACGKGYLVDIVGELLEENKITSYCVDAGGDMRQRNNEGESLKVGLENPDDIEEVIGVVNILNQSLCGSAGNRRKWGKWNHIINPKTLSPSEEVLAVWCIAEDTITADLMTTGLSFVKPETLLGHFKFEYLILYSNHSISKSDGFNAEVFIT